MKIAPPIPTPEGQRRAVQVWVETARMIEGMRHRHLPGIDTVAAIGALAGAFAIARQRSSSRLGSGLVEQQAWFARAHDRPG